LFSPLGDIALDGPKGTVLAWPQSEIRALYPYGNVRMA